MTGGQTCALQICNAMCYVRGVPVDYAGWAARGADGWDWDSVLPYFRRSEGNDRGADALHGGDGPLSVSDLRHVNPLSHAFVEAGQQAGFARNDDFNRSEEHTSELQSLMRNSYA